jgi:hypothetical protein
VTADEQFSVLMLVILGAIIVVAGTLDLLRETQVLTFSFTGLGSLPIVVLGLWIVTAP